MSRTEEILHELVNDPTLAWRVVDGATRMIHVAGPWLPECNADGVPRRWERRYPNGGTATWTTYPATGAMLDEADNRLRLSKPMLSLVGRRPCAAPGIVPECGEVHPMWRAETLGTPRHGAGIDVRCALPAGHLMACGGLLDGATYTASNAVERRVRREGP